MRILGVCDRRDVLVAAVNGIGERQCSEVEYHGMVRTVQEYMERGLDVSFGYEMDVRDVRGPLSSELTEDLLVMSDVGMILRRDPEPGTVVVGPTPMGRNALRDGMDLDPAYIDGIPNTELMEMLAQVVEAV